MRKPSVSIFIEDALRFIVETMMRLAESARWKGRSAVGLATALALTTALDHRGQAEARGFRTRVDVVRTDVGVIDNRTGKPVTGLTANDFTVTEDGVRQTTSTFVAEEGEALRGAPLSGPGSTGSAGRTFLIVLAGIREGTSDPYGGVARFLRQRLRSKSWTAPMRSSFPTMMGKTCAEIALEPDQLLVLHHTPQRAA